MEHHSQSDKPYWHSCRFCFCHNAIAKMLAVILAFATPVIASAADAADKNPTPEEVRQLTIGGVGVGIDSVIERESESDAWKLLEEGFVIECSARFESGCQLFLKTE